MNEHALADIEGPVMIACAAPLGAGGLGRHFKELVDFLSSKNLQVKNISSDVLPIWLRWAKRFTPLRFSVAWQNFVETLVFDRAVAARLPSAKTFISFSGQCFHSMQKARASGYEKVLLATAIPHINLSLTQLRKAWEYEPIEPTGYIAKQHERLLLEYELPDRILYASDLVRDSFIREKFNAEKLERFDLSADPRFKPAPERKKDSRFRVVSIGSLTMLKGVAILLDAFRDFKFKDAELTLIGGSGTSQMRRYLEGCIAQDPRVRIAPSDPLPHLQTAHACIHASFLDGFGYAPAEALACDVPVIVTLHTGMKERVREGENGFVVPTGNPQAITRALEHLLKRRPAP